MVNNKLCCETTGGSVLELFICEGEGLEKITSNIVNQKHVW